MALQNLLKYVGSHPLLIVEDLGILAVLAMTGYFVLWCLHDAATKRDRKGK
jgi:hypothetical protein